MLLTSSVVISSAMHFIYMNRFNLTAIESFIFLLTAATISFGVYLRRKSFYDSLKPKLEPVSRNERLQIVTKYYRETFRVKIIILILCACAIFILTYCMLYYIPHILYLIALCLLVCIALSSLYIAIDASIYAKKLYHITRDPEKFLLNL